MYVFTVDMSYMGQDVRLLLLSNLSVLSFRFSLLIQTGSLFEASHKCECPPPPSTASGTSVNVIFLTRLSRRHKSVSAPVSSVLVTGAGALCDPCDLCDRHVGHLSPPVRNGHLCLGRSRRSGPPAPALSSLWLTWDSSQSDETFVRRSPLCSSQHAPPAMRTRAQRRRARWARAVPGSDTCPCTFD